MSNRQKGDSISTSSDKDKSAGKAADKKAGTPRGRGGGGGGTRDDRGKQRAGDDGRALRSVYDETLREEVPDDFSDLLGKLS